MPAFLWSKCKCKLSDLGKSSEAIYLWVSLSKGELRGSNCLIHATNVWLQTAANKCDIKGICNQDNFSLYGASFTQNAQCMSKQKFALSVRCGTKLKCQFNALLFLRTKDSLHFEISYLFEMCIFEVYLSHISCTFKIPIVRFLT